VRHRSAKAQIHLTVIRARAGLVSARTALVNAARGLTKSYGERLQKCGTQQMNRESAKGPSFHLRSHLRKKAAMKRRTELKGLKTNLVCAGNCFSESDLPTAT
jgi:transposase